MRVDQQSPNFRRRLRKLDQRQPRLVAIALVRLEANPRDPRLRAHKLEGTDRWACSYAYDGRIAFVWAGELITLLDVGTHDDVY